MNRGVDVTRLGITGHGAKLLALDDVPCVRGSDMARARRRGSWCQALAIEVARPPTRPLALSSSSLLSPSEFSVSPIHGALSLISDFDH